MTGQPMQVFEVFRREREGGPMQHAGNLLAPDPELAAHYAREFYGRRQESVRLWIVPRAAIRDLADPDLLQPPFDRSFKKPAGYSAEIKRKLADARARAGAEGAAGQAGEGAEDDDPVVASGRKGVEQP
jgi:phenylacetate-CoA oxygenase PaaH subunit